MRDFSGLNKREILKTDYPTQQAVVYYAGFLNGFPVITIW
jgi:hypothetical protein